MKRTSILVSLAFLHQCNGAPSHTRRATAVGTIGTQCSNVHLNAGWVVGDCLTGSGDTRITSGTYLTHKIANDDGNLTWRDGLYGASCYDCQLLSGGSDLNCQCSPNFGQRKNTTLNLDEHIGVYAGHLLSDLKGAPNVPSTPSKYDFPSDLHYGVGGNATCPGSPEGGGDWCHNVAFQCSDTASDDFSQVNFSEYGPLGDCFIPSVYFPDHFNYNQIKLMGPGAWEMTGYADESCTQVVVKIGPEDMGVCKGLSPMVKAITVKPMFNGDPN